MSFTHLAFSSDGVRPLSALDRGATGTVVSLSPADPSRADRLEALGVTPGAVMVVLQRFPCVVFRCDQTELAVEQTVARSILIDIAEGPPARGLRPPPRGTAAMPDFRREDLMRFAIATIVALTLVGCSSLQPLPIRAGDTCFTCGRLIAEPKLAAEMIDANGRAYKFETVTCMAKDLVGHPAEKPATFVTDWSTGKWLPASNATYVRAVVDEATLAKSYYAFRSADTAAAFAKEKTSPAIDWTTVQRQVKGN